jgi:glycosyltransferase involved in cell wall biosynthesis
MKIGLIIYGSLDTLSGGYLYDRMLVDYLRKQGDSVDVISLPWGNYLSHLTDNLTFRLPPGLDVVIQDELNHPSLLAANQSPHSYPIISLVHHLRCSEQRPTWQNAFYRQLEQRYLRSVDGFIFNSQTTREVVHSLANSTKPEVVAYPPTDRFGPGLSTDAHRVEELIHARSVDESPLRLLFIGNIIPRKGLRTLLEALTLLPHDSYHLDVVGSLTFDPTHAGEMQALAQNINPANIVFHGALDHDLLAEKFRTAQVLVVPSSYEGFGIVYLEGMSFGLPAIGTRAGAAAEIIEDGITGYVIPPGDSQRLALHFTSLQRDRDLLETLSINAWQRYQRQPKWSETAGNIRSFLLHQAGKH